jgi:hypothetical protein
MSIWHSDLKLLLFRSTESHRTGVQRGSLKEKAYLVSILSSVIVKFYSFKWHVIWNIEISIDRPFYYRQQL